MHATTKTDTVVLIHGIGITPLSWEHWVAHYEQRGMKVITPGYPGIEPGEAGVAALRQDSSPIANLGVREIFNHLAKVIGALDTKPIIMGHSFGGAFVQLLLDAGYGSAGVSINGAPVKGVFSLPFSEIKSVFPVFRNPANMRRAVTFPHKTFHYGFTNNLTLAASQAVYDRYSIPVSGRMLFQAAFANFNPNAPTRCNFANDLRAPLLFIAGDRDNILPPVIQRENYQKHAKRSRAISAFKLFPGRCHYTCGEAGWETVADTALNWALAPVSGDLA